MRTCSRSAAGCNSDRSVAGGAGKAMCWKSGVLVQPASSKASAMPRNPFAVIAIAAMARSDL